MREDKCEHLDLLYRYLKSHFSSPSDPEPASLEEKKILIDEMLKRYFEHDELIRRQLEVYLKLLDLRKNLLKELQDYSDSGKALCDGDLDEKMRSYFSNSVIKHLENMLEICGKLQRLLEEASSSEGEKASKLIIYYIQENHREMINRLKNTVKIFARKLEETRIKINTSEV
ncbi:MAG: hypothetical protein OdinLCB4_007240 [Candidatus Odinarchaeum yellowstonii]|uniref:Uncharacterized protein n=1 Tax=Odinarchaeota yellowstonii (strain LCB_4) TaxID=1841599 RepID=A0AAF0IAW6_ODILC|nr:MAG: hypothetical protein OdinLCB4_007240 [Candidatus Odinarchaeum yellowstonii]